MFGTAADWIVSENKVVAYSNEEGLIQDQRLAMASTPDGVFGSSAIQATLSSVPPRRITTSKLPAYSIRHDASQSVR